MTASCDCFSGTRWGMRAGHKRKCWQVDRGRLSLGRRAHHACSAVDDSQWELCTAKDISAKEARQTKGCRKRGSRWYFSAHQAKRDNLQRQVKNLCARFEKDHPFPGKFVYSGYKILPQHLGDVTEHKKEKTCSKCDNGWGCRLRLPVLSCHRQHLH